MSVDNEKPVDEADWRMTLRRSGNSVCVTLPPALLKLADIESGDEVDLVKRLGDDGIRMKPVREQVSDETREE